LIIVKKNKVMNKEHLHPEGRPYTKEEFVEKIKTDKKFADRFGNLGPVYGKQWRSWKQFKTIHVDELDKTEGIYKIHSTEFTHTDQIANLIQDLKTNPDSRRLLVSAWNPAELDQMVLPPCHYGFQVYTRELSFDERFLILSDRNLIDSFHNLSDKKYNSRLNELNIPTRTISLMWNQRSVDTFLGLPFNIASYGLLLEIIAKAVNMVPDELIGNLGDVHLYSNHIEQAKEQIGREPYPLPKLIFNPIFLANLEHKGFDEAINGQINFDLEDYQSHPSIKAPLSN
jgi:thymidylate synthase